MALLRQYHFRLDNEIHEDCIKLKKLPIVFTEESAGDIGHVDMVSLYATEQTFKHRQNYKIELYSREYRNTRLFLLGSLRISSEILEAIHKLYWEELKLYIDHVTCEISIILKPKLFIECISDDIQFVIQSAFTKVPYIKHLLKYLYKLKDNCVKKKLQEQLPINNNGINDLYDHVKKYHNSLTELAVLTIDEDILQENLNPTLRDYQLNAVKWMLYKEMQPQYLTEHGDIHPLWEEIRCDDGKKIYFNTYSGVLTKQKFLAKPLPSGGILAEEMGLGKTVEVLACVVCNQSPVRFKLELINNVETITVAETNIELPTNSETPTDTETKTNYTEIQADIELQDKQIDTKIKTDTEIQNDTEAQNDIEIQTGIKTKSNDIEMTINSEIQTSLNMQTDTEKIADTLTQTDMELKALLKWENIDCRLDKDKDNSIDGRNQDKTSLKRKLESPLNNIHANTSNKKQIKVNIDITKDLEGNAKNESPLLISNSKIPIQNGSISCLLTTDSKIPIQNGSINSLLTTDSEIPIQNGSINSLLTTDSNIQILNGSISSLLTTDSNIQILNGSINSLPTTDSNIQIPNGDHKTNLNNEIGRIVDNVLNISKVPFSPIAQFIQPVPIGQLVEQLIPLDIIQSNEQTGTVNSNIHNDESIECENISKETFSTYNSKDNNQILNSFTNSTPEVKATVLQYKGKKEKLKSTRLCEQILNSITNLTPEVKPKKIAIQDKGKKEKPKITRLCFMCADRYHRLAEKVKCMSCINVMHQKCSGYMELNVKHYECPDCANRKLTDTHCTLIVCPDTLLSQWTNEVEKHLKQDKLKFLVYSGIKKQGYIHPSILGEYDLLITSFGTLREEFNYVLSTDLNTRRLRHKKKYALLPCPLLGLNFWRMCIDEAQMVEGDNTKLAEMALRITAKHAWCVTGTPLQRSVEDIYGLFLFLGVDPYKTKVWWKRALLDHYNHGECEPLFQLAAKSMWRTKKSDVIEQIQIPKQTEYITFLQFSAVEQHFYRREHKSCAEKIQNELAERYEEMDELNLNNLSKQSTTSLLRPLLSLRQACCHPAVVRSAHIAIDKNCITMQEILDKLMLNEKLEAEEAHRQLLAALNGLAGIEVLTCSYKSAIQIYQQAISSWKQHKDIKTDSLQRLHTYHNLLEVEKLLFTSIQTETDSNAVVIPSISSSSAVAIQTSELYEVKMKKIRSKYLGAVDSKVVKNDQLLVISQTVVQDLHSKLEMKNPWWLSVIQQAINLNVQGDLITRLHDGMPDHLHKSESSIRGSFRSVQGLQLVLHNKLKYISEMRDSVLKQLTTVSIYPAADVIQQTAECCLRPRPVQDEGDEESIPPRCMYCCTDDMLNDYEKVIYSQQGYQRNIDSDTANTGFRSMTEIDYTLKILTNCAKVYSLPDDVVKQGGLHTKYQEALKKEFNSIRAAFVAYHQRVQALDELDMCTMRLRYAYNGEEDVDDMHHVIKYGDEKFKRLTFESDKKLAEMELKKKLGQLLYLQGLKTSQSESEGYNVELCPICVCQLGTQWAVFQCGHCICCECVSHLQRQSIVYVRSQEARIRCPMCRALTPANDVSFVQTKEVNQPDGFDAHCNVKGNYSTKIEAVVRRIKWIQQQDDTNKVLVFSTWQEALRLTSRALCDNDILFKHSEGDKRKFQENLSVFQNSFDYNVLLLPLHSGAKGLNIIEATHVILVEPALNPGDELQAVGRVHRIGQTKPTFVHRFIIKGTVEEKMYDLRKSKCLNEDEESQGNFELKLSDLTTLMT